MKKYLTRAGAAFVVYSLPKPPNGAARSADNAAADRPPADDSLTRFVNAL